MDALEIVSELATPDVGTVHGLTWDGAAVWCADGRIERPVRIDPTSGHVTQTLDCPADAGTAFDGEQLWQIGGDRARRLDLVTGRITRTLVLPDSTVSGMSWADGSLFIGSHVGKYLIKVDPLTGAVLSRIESDAHVCGVAWVDGNLWHCAWTTRHASPSGHAELRQIEPSTGEVRRRFRFPSFVSGIESDGSGHLWCGLNEGGRLLRVRIP